MYDSMFLLLRIIKIHTTVNTDVQASFLFKFFYSFLHTQVPLPPLLPSSLPPSPIHERVRPPMGSHLTLTY